MDTNPKRQRGRQTTSSLTFRVGRGCLTAVRGQYNRNNLHNRLRFPGWRADLVEGSSPVGDPFCAIDRKPSHVGAWAVQGGVMARQKRSYSLSRLLLATSMLLLPFTSGCVLGPTALRKTHGRYHDAVKQVQDEAPLRNLVRLRYTEALSTLEIASITAQFEADASAEARPFFGTLNPAGTDIFRTFTRILPDVTASGADRPTISLQPADEAQEITRFLRRLSAENFAFFVESGISPTYLSLLWFDSINRVNNAPVAAKANLLEAEIRDYAAFRRSVELLEELERKKIVQFVVREPFAPVGRPVTADRVSQSDQLEAVKEGMEYRDGPTPGTLVLVRRQRSLRLKINGLAEGCPALIEFCHLLNLEPGQSEYELIVGEVDPFPATFPPPPRRQIVLEPRSTFEALIYMSHGVIVPAEHVEQGLVRQTLLPDGQLFDWSDLTRGIFQVQHVKQHHRPDHAYVAVRFHDYWFYIDDRDHNSKMAFNQVYHLSRLDLAVPGARLERTRPVLTLPIGR